MICVRNYIRTKRQEKNRFQVSSHNWRTLKLIQSNFYSQQRALSESKIHKTVRTLTNIELVGDAIMSEQDLKQIKDKATITLAILDKIEKPPVMTVVSVTTQRKQSTEVKPPIPVNTSEIINSLGLPANFDQTRLKVLQTLIEKFGVPSVPQMQAAIFWRKLENEVLILIRRQINSKQKDRQYQASIKEMFKYLQNDKDNSVKTRLLTGLIDVPSAAMLKTEDWTSATVILDVYFRDQLKQVVLVERFYRQTI
ncbi:hypothetical protein FGO68_gene3977 [Halteria grandinella]|uniref:Uncharacterized protein n=1 Tax=Halteria grandinella TaxID=5974 RepID=A0A8J8SUP4_HALGN|nr:hypothetical protein FGO68_gene3977 [Halteria grandinella]